MAERKRKYTWFIEPLDAYTNDIVASEFDADTNFFRNRKCGDGIRRNLWQVTAKFAKIMDKSRSEKNLDFHILVQEGNGQIRLWNLAFQKKFKRVKK